MRVTLKPDNITKEIKISYLQTIYTLRKKISEEF